MILLEEENLKAAFPDTYFTFQLGDKYFGFEARCLWEISLAVSVSPIPPSAPFLVGVTHLHGKIVPVLDLGALLGLPGLTPGSFKGFVAVKPFGWEAPAGFCVGNILGFEKFPQGRVSPPTPEQEHFRKGCADTPYGRVELLDMSRLLSGLKPSSPAGVPPDFTATKGEKNV